ncbi:glutaminyl-peptide cyclotransferase [Actinosynnema sp. NPDC023587]|uniref:glutaminyl-peptide cyclotransferase n=1 Tax=Actinosynnema sp. NPDC023587 TaxID=3154695 RepID=UPI0033DE8139
MQVFAAVRVVAKVPVGVGAGVGLALSADGLVEFVVTPAGSALRVVDVGDGREVRRMPLADRRDVAGVAVTSGGLWQVSSGVAVLRDPVSLAEKRRVPVGGVPSGACAVGRFVVVGDGTDRLVLRDSVTLKEVRAVTVSGHWAAGQRLGALTCVREDGRAQVWAVVAGSDWLVRIDVESGRVTGVASVARIRAEEPGAGGAVGGIVAAREPGELWVSGGFRHRFKVRLGGAGR